MIFVASVVDRQRPMQQVIADLAVMRGAVICVATLMSIGKPKTVDVAHLHASVLALRSPGLLFGVCPVPMRQIEQPNCAGHVLMMSDRALAHIATKKG